MTVTSVSELVSKRDLIRCFFYLLAVQHERGPRKPKIKVTDDAKSMLPSHQGRAPAITHHEMPIDLRVPRKMDTIPPAFFQPVQQPNFLHSLIPTEHFPDFRVSSAFCTENMLETSAFRIPHHPSTSSCVVEGLQEVTARMLFNVITWIRGIASFRSLPDRDQVCINNWVVHLFCNQ